MITAIATWIVEILARHKIINDEDADIYQYGFEIMISSAMTCIIAIAVGIILNCLIASLIYLGLFITLRSICGGYHAKTYWKCNLIFTFVTLFVLAIFKFITIEQFYEFHFICIALSIIITAVYAPVENEKKPLSKQQKIYFRILSMVMILLLSLISCLLIIKFRNEYGILIDSTLLVVAISMFVTNPWKGGDKI